MSKHEIEVPAPVQEVLLEGDNVLWVGRPRQTLLEPQDFVSLPLSFLLLFAGLYVFCYVRPAWHPRVVAVGGLAVSAAAANSLWQRLWILPHRRWRTWYALTHHRAIMIQQGRWLASYLLHSGLDVAHLKKGASGTIVFGTRLKRSHETELPPESVRSFVLTRGSDEVYTLVRSLTGRRDVEHHVAPMAHTPPIPLGKRNLSDVSDVKAGTLGYAQPIREKLRPGEHTLWVGRPGGAIDIGWKQRRQILIGAPILIVLVLTMTRWRGSNQMAVGGIFIAVALLAAGHAVYGHLVEGPRQWRRIWYTLTNMRVLFVRDDAIIETASVWRPMIQGLVLETPGGELGTVHVDLTASGRAEIFDAAMRLGGLVAPGLALVSDARSLHDLIVRWASETSHETGESL